MRAVFKKIIKFILDLIAFVLIRTLILILECLPDTQALSVSNFYIKILFSLMPKLEKTARTNLSIVYPQKSEQEKEDLFQKSKEVLAKNILGFSRIPKLKPKQVKQKYEMHQQAAILDSLTESSNGVGILIAALHFDAFEYLIHIPAILYKPFSILGRGFGLPIVDAWWNSRRQMHGNIIFSRKGGYKEIIRRLNNGENVIVMCDQNVKSKHAVFVDFFGLPAATAKTIALCSMRTGCKVAMASMISLDQDSAEFTVEPLLTPDEVEGEKEEKIKAVTENMHRAFEKQIQRKPEAWFWIHRRWKTRPKGEAEDIYTRYKNTIKKTPLKKQLL